MMYSEKIIGAAYGLQFMLREFAYDGVSAEWGDYFQWYSKIDHSDNSASAIEIVSVNVDDESVAVTDV